MSETVSGDLQVCGRIFEVEIELDPTIEDAGTVHGFDVYLDDEDTWQVVATYEEECLLYEWLDQIRDSSGPEIDFDVDDVLYY